MTLRHRPVHGTFDGLKEALLASRHTVRGRPASFVTNEQLTASGQGSKQTRMGRPHQTLFADR